jgi:hypothetical protein
LLDELNVLRFEISQFVPRPMSVDQNEYHIPVCTKLKEQAEKSQIYIHHQYW